MISVCFQGKPLNITVIQVYAPTSNDKETEVEWFYDDLQDLLELAKTKKRCTFHHRGLKCKSRKSRETRSNKQVGLGVQNETGKQLKEFCQENAMVIANTLFQQHNRRLCTWPYQMVTIKIVLIILFAAEDGEVLYSHQK